MTREQLAASENCLQCFQAVIKLDLRSTPTRCVALLNARTDALLNARTDALLCVAEISGGVRMCALRED